MKRRRHMWVEFVVGSLPLLHEVFVQVNRFPLLLTETKEARRRTTMGLASPKNRYLFIFSIFLFVYLVD